MFLHGQGKTSSDPLNKCTFVVVHHLCTNFSLDLRKWMWAKLCNCKSTKVVFLWRLNLIYLRVEQQSHCILVAPMKIVTELLCRVKKLILPLSLVLWIGWLKCEVRKHWEFVDLINRSLISVWKNSLAVLLLALEDISFFNQHLSTNMVVWLTLAWLLEGQPIVSTTKVSRWSVIKCALWGQTLSSLRMELGPRLWSYVVATGCRISSSHLAFPVRATPSHCLHQKTLLCQCGNQHSCSPRLLHTWWRSQVLLIRHLIGCTCSTRVLSHFH